MTTTTVTTIMINNIPDFHSKPKEFQFSMAFCADETSLGFVPSQIRSDLSAALSDRFSLSPSVSSLLAEHLYTQFDSYLSSGILTPSPESTQALLSPTDTSYILGFTPYNSPEESPQIRSLLLAFLLFYHSHYHPSGWVRYNKKEIFHLASLSRLPSKDQEALTNRLHTHYGLNMRVVGSNQPTPCFSLDWARHTPELALNPVGDLTPEFVSTFSMSLLNNEKTTNTTTKTTTTKED